MNKREFTRAANWVGQKWQALTHPVHETDSRRDITEYLKNRPAHAIALSLSPQQIKDIADAYRAYEHARTQHAPNGFRSIQSTCKAGAPLAVSNKITMMGGPSPVNMRPAEEKLINAFRSIVEPLYEGHEYQIDFFDGPQGGNMHTHKGAFRFATMGFDTPTEFPGLLENQRASADTILCFGPDFWHTPPDNERPVMTSYCTLGR